MKFNPEKNLNIKNTKNLEKIRKFLYPTLKLLFPTLVIAASFKGDNPEKIQNDSEDINNGTKIDNPINKDFIKNNKDTISDLKEQIKDSLQKIAPDSVKLDTVNKPNQTVEETTDTNLSKELLGGKDDVVIKKEEPKKNLEGGNQEEIFESATDLADGIDKILDEESGVILYFVNNKLELHKEDVLNSIKTIDLFIQDNKEYFDILEKEGVFSENENIKFGQINALAMCYELYNNGGLKDIFSHGILEKVVFSIVFTKYQFYKKFNNIEKDLAKNKLNDKESLEKIERFKKILNRDLSKDEVRHILFLIEIAKELKKPIETIYQTPRDAKGFMEEGKKDISSFEKEEIRVMCENPELIKLANRLLDFFFNLKK